MSIAGSGNVKAEVTGAAKVDVMGSGDVDLGKGARCTTSKMGSGSVTWGYACYVGRLQQSGRRRMPVRMIRLPTLFALSLIVAGPVQAAPARSYSVGSFDRLRVDGPFRVVLTTGQSPGAKAEGDPRITDTLDIRVEGTTLIVRAGINGWGEQPGARDGGAPVIRVSTGMIRSAVLIGGGDVTIVGPLRGQRIDLSLTGSGSFRADNVDTDQLVASAIGSGSMTLGGRAARVTLGTNGPVRMQAGGLIASDLTVRADGNGDLFAQARFTAAISSSGVGSVTVYGKPACSFRGVPDGPVSCGKLMPPPLLPS